MGKELFKRIGSSLLLVPIVFFFIIKGSIFFNIFTIVLILITLYEWHFLSSKKIYYFPGFIFIFFSYYTFYFFRIENDYLFFLLILITCIATDIGGYIFGKLFKGPKLIKISPNKTYSGMIGGFILASISANFFINYLSNFKFNQIEDEIGINLMIIILLISFMSQVGDLIISFFKRKSKIKNTGKIIPGHGGLLDRIDGMIFVFPFMYILINIL